MKPCAFCLERPAVAVCGGVVAPERHCGAAVCDRHGTIVAGLSEPLCPNCAPQQERRTPTEWR